MLRRVSPLAAVSAFVLLFVVLTLAPTGVSAGSTTDAGAKTSPPPIQDNSFLIEEAYNQEDGVVQHISTFTRGFDAHSWLYTFTQEWPVGGLRHQFSYTVSALSTDQSRGTGLGDVAINYRYQLIGSGDTRLAFAPRVSLLVPTADARAGRGFGGFGCQFNLPASVVVNKRFVTHWNAGATLVPRARDAAGDRAFNTGYNLGQSVIWLAHPRFNVLVETTWAANNLVSGPNQTRSVHDLLVSPGVRWVHNLRGGLQVVPGIGIPLGVGPSSGERGVIVYLSFEHPFRATAK